MISKYKESIRTLKREVNDLMMQDISGMTQNSIMERDLTVQSKISIVRIFTKEYEKHHHDVIMIGDQKQLKAL